MMEDKLLIEEAYEKARSFPGLTPPNNAALIGAVSRGEDTWFYYQDSEGNFYYDSRLARKFEKEMQERKRQREIKRWREKKRAV